jgi:DNA-binding transcriptional ArsR family regulator
MARAPVTSDAFNAIAEPQRRSILLLLRSGERPVNDVAQALRMAQPQASKHLQVLREVGLVRARKEGRRRFYTLEPDGLRPVREWLGEFEQFWTESFERLEEYARELERANDPSTRKPHESD